MVKELLMHWPVVRQLLTHSDGTGVEAMSDRTRNLAPKHRAGEVARSVRPYFSLNLGRGIVCRKAAISNDCCAVRVSG